MSTPAVPTTITRATPLVLETWFWPTIAALFFILITGFLVIILVLAQRQNKRFNEDLTALLQATKGAPAGTYTSAQL